MDKNGNARSSADENVSNLGFESLSLGQRLLSKCLKKTGISVSVRGIAVNTTSQIKTAGSAWKSEAKYDPSLETKTGTLDDVSFPDLLGSSNRDASVNNQHSERSSVTNENERMSKDARRSKYKMKHRLPSVHSVNSPAFQMSRDGSFANSSYSFKNSNFEDEDDILGSDFLMPGMKGNYPLGFTNFIGKGVQSPPPPPPSLPYPTNPHSIYQSYQQYTITRLKANKIQVAKPHTRTNSPTLSDSNWLDNKSDGYNEAELTTAIDSLNHSILADRPEALTIKPYASDKLSQSYMELTNFQDDPMLQNSLSNDLDGRIMDHLGSQLDDRLVNELSDHLEDRLASELHSQLSGHLGEQLPGKLERVLEATLEPGVERLDQRMSSEFGPVSSGPDKRRKERYVRRRKFNQAPATTSSVATASSGTHRHRRERKEKDRDTAKSTPPAPVTADAPEPPQPVAKPSPKPTKKPAPAPPKPTAPTDNPEAESVAKVDKGDKEPTKPRRPRNRVRSRKKDAEDESWRAAGDPNEPKNENAVDSQNTHEKKHVKPRSRFKHQRSNTTSTS